MMTIQEITEKLQYMMPSKRFKHSMGVKDAALKLARRYGADEEKAIIAGLIHDCAKGLSKEDLLKLAEEFGIVIDDVQRTEVKLLHAPIGAEIARREFGIDDDEILKAIRYHTTGCKNMDLLTKIIYVADYIEEGRRFPEVQELRRIAFINLDAAVIMGMDLTIQYIISENGLIHEDTVQARNYLIAINSGLDYRKL